jgi:haloalkane dehalogenase
MKEKAYYAKSRTPLLAWPRSVPIEGKPEDIASMVANYHEWLKETDIPKLCFYVSPGVAMKDSDIEIIKKNFKNIAMIYLGKGLHFIQENYPHKIGIEIAKWYSSIN